MLATRTLLQALGFDRDIPQVCFKHELQSSTEMRAWTLVLRPRAIAVLPVAVIKGACRLILRGGVPGQIGVQGFEMAECPSAETAAVPL